MEECEGEYQLPDSSESFSYPFGLYSKWSLHNQNVKFACYHYICHQSREEGKDQESIQSSTSPDRGYQIYGVGFHDPSPLIYSCDHATFMLDCKEYVFCKLTPKEVAADLPSLLTIMSPLYMALVARKPGPML